MRVLVIGLGSMGKRRIRCLQALGVDNVVGFDIRQDRQLEVSKLYGVPTTNDVEQAISEADTVVISTPPDLHTRYIDQCIKYRKHHFIEASVLREGLAELAKRADSLGLVSAPSATLMFHPAIAAIDKSIKSGRIGSVLNFTYHSGQYLPDWHVYEHVSEYYVSNPSVGGAREIVPFELSWLVKCFGWPSSVKASVRSTATIPGAEKVFDCYNLILNFSTGTGVVTVDSLARVATRKMTIVGSTGQLEWNWDDASVSIYDGLSRSWSKTPYDQGKAAVGYHANIGEQMYIDEVREFLEAAGRKTRFRNTMSDDIRVLDILCAAELSAKEERTINL